MQRELNNSLSRYAIFTSGSSLLGLNIAAVVLLFLGLAAAISTGAVAASILVGIAIVTVCVFTAFSAIQRSAAQSAKAVDWVDWHSAMPEIQKQNLNIAVTELAQILEAGRESISDLQSAFLVAEDLALRQIQQEEKAPILRHISVCDVPFDAAFVKNGVLNCGEVAFLVSPDFSEDRLASARRKIAAVQKAIKEMNVALKLRLLIILVTQMNEDDLEKLRNSLDSQRFASTPVDIDIRLLDFEVLQRIFVTEK